MRWDPERSRKACYNARAVNLFIGQNKQASPSTFISPWFHNLGAEMRGSLSGCRGRACWMLGDGCPPEQKSLWSTAIYWSSKLVQSIQKKRRGETTLEEKIAYLRSLKSGRGGCIHIVIGEILYVDPAHTHTHTHTHTHRPRWKEMHFSTETNKKALYYFLGSARNVMRKLAEGKKKSVKGLVGMRYEMRQWCIAGTLRLSRLSSVDIPKYVTAPANQVCQLCIQISSYRGPGRPTG